MLGFANRENLKTGLQIVPLHVLATYVDLEDGYRLWYGMLGTQTKPSAAVVAT